MLFFEFMVIVLMISFVVFLWIAYYLVTVKWAKASPSTSESTIRIDLVAPKTVRPTAVSKKTAPPQIEEKIPQAIAYFKQLWTGTPKISTCDEFNDLFTNAIGELQKPENAGVVTEDNMLTLIRKFIDPKIPDIQTFYNTLFEKMVYEYECVGFPGQQVYDAKPLLAMMIQNIKDTLGGKITDCADYKKMNDRIRQEMDKLDVPNTNSKQAFFELLENRIQDEIDEEYNVEQMIWKINKTQLDQCGRIDFMSE
jgi:hypothetical protein